MNNRFGHQARQALGSLLRQPATRRLTLWSGLIYAFVYLWAVGDFNFHPWRPGFSVVWTQAPLEMLFKQRNLFYFEGIAIINLPIATYLFSPVNLLLGLLLGMLVGFNLTFTYLSFKHSKAYQGRGVLTVLVSIPALLAGMTCSAPLVLVLLGIQASAWLLALFNYLIPLALILLSAALVVNIRHSRDGPQ